MVVRRLAAAALFVGALAGTIAGAMADTLRSLAEAAGIHVGAAVDVAVLNTDEAYARLLAREFDLVTPENAMKFSVVHPGRDRFDFSQADALVAFAEAHGMQVNGHVLVWDQQLPDWLTRGHFSRDALKAILREHIQTLVTRYRGRIASWDVAAEAVGQDGRLRETFWSRGIGPKYLEWAFRWAHEADPHARLRYNDYGGEGAGIKSDGIYDLVAALRRKGAPISSVGLQMHVSLQDAPDARDVRINMKRLAALGLDTDITEMDVMLTQPATRESLRGQAGVYRDMLKTCLAVPQCRSFATWGATDRYSWIPEYFPGQGTALLFDARYRQKPAYRSVLRVLEARIGRDRNAEPSLTPSVSHQSATPYSTVTDLAKLRGLSTSVPFWSAAW
jgi:endo-1,4-beta-xylanase